MKIIIKTGLIIAVISLSGCNSYKKLMGLPHKQETLIANNSTNVSWSMDITNGENIVSQIEKLNIEKSEFESINQHKNRLAPLEGMIFQVVSPVKIDYNAETGFAALHKYNSNFSSINLNNESYLRNQKQEYVYSVKLFDHYHSSMPLSINGYTLNSYGKNQSRYYHITMKGIPYSSFGAKVEVEPACIIPIEAIKQSRINHDTDIVIQFIIRLKYPYLLSKTDYISKINRTIKDYYIISEVLAARLINLTTQQVYACQLKIASDY